MTNGLKYSNIFWFFSVLQCPVNGFYKMNASIMKNSTLLLLVLTVSVCFSACKKEKAKTRTELLTQTSWKFDKAMATGYGDVSSQINACFKDNIITFVSNGTGTVTEEAVVCSPSTAGNFTWEFQANETSLLVSAQLFSGAGNLFTIVSITETNLVLSQIVPLPAPISANVNVEVTFKH